MSRWIPVESGKLPPVLASELEGGEWCPSEPVLLAAQDQSIPWVGYWDYTGKRWELPTLDKRVCVLENVTHWMPMMELPGE